MCVLVDSLWYPFRTDSTPRYAFTGGVLVMLQLIGIGFPLVLGYIYRVQRQQANTNDSRQKPLNVRQDFDEIIYHGLNIAAGLVLLAILPVVGLVVTTLGLRTLSLPVSVAFTLLSVSSLSTLLLISAVYCFPGYMIVYAEADSLIDSLDITQLLGMVSSLKYAGLQVRLVFVTGVYAVVGNAVIYVSSFLPALVVVTVPVGAASLFLGIASAGYLIGEASEDLHH